MQPPVTLLSLTSAITELQERGLSSKGIKAELEKRLADDKKGLILEDVSELDALEKGARRARAESSLALAAAEHERAKAELELADCARHKAKRLRTDNCTVISTDLIRLNVGGDKFSTTRSALLLSGATFFEPLLQNDFSVATDEDGQCCVHVARFLRQVLHNICWGGMIRDCGM